MTEEKHVSLDIEACGEVLLSIGACEFDPLTGQTDNPFYVVVEAQPQIDAGLRMDGGAFNWWLKQSDGARAAIATVPAARPPDSLEALRRWWPDRNAWCWAYPTSYDLPVIARVAARFEVKPPWKWQRTMCGRTLWQLACMVDPKMAEIEKVANPAAHHALADAQEQAEWYAKYLSTFSMGGRS